MHKCIDSIFSLLTSGCRGVIMIGLPFANRGSVELIEKMKYAQERNVSLS